MSAISTSLNSLSFDERLAQKQRRLQEARPAEAASGAMPSDRSQWWPLAGLAPMTRVRTIFGDVHAIALRKGDEVLTASGEYKPILWLNRVLLDAAFLAEKPDSHPVCIRAGAFGGKSPAHDIMVSPRQIVEDRSGDLVEAAALIGTPGVTRFCETGLSYTMFHLGRPETVIVEGARLRTAPPVN